MRRTAICLLPLMMTGCIGVPHSPPPSKSSPPSPTAQTTPAAQPTATSPTAVATVAPGPHIHMLPEIAVPAGSTERDHQEADEEAWYFTAPFDQTAAMIKAQLPVGQPFRGVPYCKGDDTVKPGAEIVAWEWTTDTEDLFISVTGPSLAINPKKLGETLFRWQPVTDGNGRDGCTAPLPDSYSAQPPPGPRSTVANNSGPLPHSDKAEINLLISSEKLRARLDRPFNVEELTADLKNETFLAAHP
jgi:hypothetical protein